MEISEEQYKIIEPLFPKARGTKKYHNLQALNGILYIAEQGCKWRALPERFGRWHTIYMRASRWAKSGVLDRVFSALQETDVINIQVDSICIDSTVVKVHPDGTGVLKKTAPKPLANQEPDGQVKFIW